MSDLRDAIEHHQRGYAALALEVPEAVHRAYGATLDPILDAAEAYAELLDAVEAGSLVVVESPCDCVLKHGSAYCAGRGRRVVLGEGT